MIARRRWFRYRALKSPGHLTQRHKTFWKSSPERVKGTLADMAVQILCRARSRKRCYAARLIAIQDAAVMRLAAVALVMAGAGH
jgi:hypothetical protein